MDVASERTGVQIFRRKIIFLGWGGVDSFRQDMEFCSFYPYPSEISLIFFHLTPSLESVPATATPLARGPNNITKLDPQKAEQASGRTFFNIEMKFFIVEKMIFSAEKHFFIGQNCS